MDIIRSIKKHYKDYIEFWDTKYMLMDKQIESGNFNEADIKELSAWRITTIYFYFNRWK